VIWPDSAMMLDLDASLSRNSWVVRWEGERRGGGAGALGLAPPLELMEAGRLRAADGVEAKQHEREREKRMEKRDREGVTGGPITTWHPQYQNHPSKLTDGQT
jgi:hypothetical protein